MYEIKTALALLLASESTIILGEVIKLLWPHT